MLADFRESMATVVLPALRSLEISLQPRKFAPAKTTVVSRIIGPHSCEFRGLSAVSM